MSALLHSLGRVNRQFKVDRPNQLWVSDFTDVSTWQGWLYVAFVIDMYARRIAGWRVSRSNTTDFVLDALEQALYMRQPERDDNALAETINGLAVFNSKPAELSTGAAWMTREALEMAMLE